MNLKEIVRKELLSEQGRKRDVIRRVIKDIVTVFKNEDEGEYFLPEYFEDRDEMVYDFMTMGESFSIEMIMEVNDEIDSFKVNAEIYSDDHSIKLVIQYNSDKKNQILYDLIGELNEVIAHELRHIDQNIVVELKSVKSLRDDHTTQCGMYMKLLNIESGLVINFPCGDNEDVDFQELEAASPVCRRCGRDSHMASGCYAKKHLDGSVL